ncbi:hypothetical protein [Lacticaseibacillus paracasei]|uniref:Uncharacterized protein n=1 Tax=Lacticaseibacillus paracasei NRIC 0644 TaxID=1435038 RepID=A0A0C9Q8K5_LACPA|nr:hypothetical protein [Lacticaseibacillus paracasei]GAN36177.1 hypothetical protein LC0644_0766 [Lacticaseibacillus paracasei NRIC 0644]GAN40739.1 hypothetical protein LC1917_2616 [Lacticaseibacillus paracasei NRIC 1917]
MADFIASMIAGIITLIICARGLYASIISFSLFDSTFKWFDAFVIVLMVVNVIGCFAVIIFVCREFFSERKRESKP